MNGNPSNGARPQAAPQVRITPEIAALIRATEAAVEARGTPAEASTRQQMFALAGALSEVQAEHATFMHDMAPLAMPNDGTPRMTLRRLLRDRDLLLEATDGLIEASREGGPPVDVAFAKCVDAAKRAHQAAPAARDNDEATRTKAIEKFLADFPPDTLGIPEDQLAAIGFNAIQKARRLRRGP